VQEVRRLLARVCGAPARPVLTQLCPLVPLLLFLWLCAVDFIESSCAHYPTLAGKYLSIGELSQAK
jgi:hypothetical protein